MPQVSVKRNLENPETHFDLTVGDQVIMALTKSGVQQMYNEMGMPGKFDSTLIPMPIIQPSNNGATLSTDTYTQPAPPGNNIILPIIAVIVGFLVLKG